MTNFTKDNIQNDGEYVTYRPFAMDASKDYGFIARFKHVRGNKAGFIKFLINNMTVEEYFAARNAGIAPVTILEERGYVPTHIQKWLKNGTLKDWKGKTAAEWRI